MPAERRILVAGASGVVGRAALERLSAEHECYGLSRRPPGTARGTHVVADLTDGPGTATALATLPPVTHLVYAALFEKPGLLEGWRAQDQIDTNERMLRNCLDALADHPLAHVSLLQGTKAYGAHVAPMRVPGREREPRVTHENFYWRQEDLLRARAIESGFDFTIWRPPVIFGHAIGAPMNLLSVLAVYAAVCVETGEDFAFPGGACGPMDGVDARLLADAMAWATDDEAARGRTFNVVNGDVMHWPDLWPAIADAFDLPPAPPTPRRLATWLPERADAWDRAKARHGSPAPDLVAFTGDSLIYADMLFGFGRDRPPPPALLSGIALRKAGFAECVDSEDMLREWIAILRAEGFVPGR